jgi:hypothetical protein
MEYDLKKPCATCPFRRGTPMILMPGRVEEIAGNMLNPGGGEFPCHKTIEYIDDDDDGSAHREKPHSKHCAGALIFAEKNETSTQLMRICERIGMYDATALMGPANKENVDAVFDTFDEMMAHNKGLKFNVDKPRRRRRKSSR